VATEQCPARSQEEEAVMTRSHLTYHSAALEVRDRNHPRPAPGRALAVLLALALMRAAPVWAAGVVGDGTPESCTETALNAALAGGGTVTFDCGASPDTITVTFTETITEDTTIDGGSLVTISGGDNVLVFNVLSSLDTGVAFTLQNLTIADGKGAEGGSGGIHNDGGGRLTVTNCTLSGNIGGGIDNYGTLTVTNSIVSGNRTDPGYGGGGIANLASGTLTVTNSTFSGNESDGGSGIYNAGMLTVINSTFSSNSATTAGGAIYNDGGTLAITGSTFFDNDAASGGGIWNSGDLSVTNCTFFRNMAPNLFGGDGGGISNSGNLTVTNCTFAGNGARGFFGYVNGGGISNHGGTVTVVNSILADGALSCAGVFTDGGHNLDDGTTCAFSAANGSLSNTDPKLNPDGLQDNGGPTQTIALQADSPAINAGDESVCAAAPVNGVDQRGYVRPGANAISCSIGAYEYNSVPAQSCSGDCNGSRDVTVDELITLVNIDLGSADASTCPYGIPSGSNVDVVLIVQAVNNALSGCGGG
jgi:predicted outer membrane repeat protein